MSTTPRGYEPFETGPLTEPTAPEFEREQADDVLDPLPYQREYLNYGETYHAIVTGIGAGKTTALIQRIALNAQVWNPGRTGVVVVPTVPSLRNVLIPELRKWGYLQIGEWYPSKNRWTLPNGSTVIFESADNDRKIQRLRGPNIAWFGMDEPSTIAKTAWDVMVGRLREGDYINAFVSGTPKGFNWVYDTFVDPDEALDSTNLVTGVSSKDNPHLPDIYTDEILEQYEGQFYEQEVLGQFTQFEGLIYPWFDDDNLVSESPEPGEYDEVIYGVDWGHNNPSTVLALVRDGETWTAVEEHYETRQTVSDHSRAMRDIQDRWGPGTIYCDPSEPANIEQFQRDGLDAKAAENDVTPGIQHVSSMREDLHVVETCQNLRNEFSQYQYKDGQDKPEKANDHLTDSLRYALFTHANTTPKADPFPFQ
jgi:PBSX family phage terminase large subunit